MQKKHDGEQETSSLSHNNPLVMTPTNTSNGRGMTPTPPTSERRQRKTLLIQKQRINYIQQQNSLNIPNMNNNNSNGNNINNGSTSSIRSLLSSSRSIQHPVDCDISESSNRSLPSVSSTTTNTNPTTSTTSTPMTMANRILFRRSSTQYNQQQSATSIRIKRFIHIMLMVAVFCLLGLLREQTVNGSNQRFRMGTIDEVKHQSADDDGHLLKKKAQRKKQLENLVQMPPLHTPMTSLHQQPDMPMTALHPQNKDGEGSLAMHQEEEEEEPQQPQQSTTITQAETTTVATSDALAVADTTKDHTETDATTDTSGSNNADSTPKTSKPATTSTASTRKRNQNKPILQKLPKAYPRAPYDSSMKLQPPNLPADTSNNHTFVRQYCDLQGTDWFPQHNAKHTTSTNNATNQWHQRAPFVLLLGPDHGGSDMLYQLLSTHPQMADALQSQFFTFNAKKFAKQTNVPAATSADGSSTSTTTKVRIRTRAARRAYMARHVRTQRQLQSHSSQIVLDNVPETLLYEHVMAPLILCAMPWVKLVLVVKHPLQRLLQQYQAAQRRGLSLSLETWIARDLERMQQAGLLVAPPGSSATANEQQRQAALEAITNRQAWERYQQQTHTAWEASVGQSLYEAMVQPWFQWMQDAGRNPQTEIVVVQYEVFTSSKIENAVEKEYASLLRQLGLAPHTPPAPLMESIQKQAARERETWKTEFGDDKVRKQLKHFFQPYNKLFDEFLQQTYGTATISGAEDDERLLRWKPGLWKSG